MVAAAVVGSAVVRALLETAGTRLTLLVRTKQGQQLGDRLGQLLRFLPAFPRLFEIAVDAVHDFGAPAVAGGANADGPCVDIFTSAFRACSFQ